MPFLSLEWYLCLYPERQIRINTLCRKINVRILIKERYMNISEVKSKSIGELNVLAEKLNVAGAR